MVEATFPFSLFEDSLRKWFVAQQRDLPWREPQNMSDPYRVLVSEVMLQQTTVAAVIPFYHRFLDRFPDVATLAGADIDDILPLWAGLGYYSRARNLHAAAQAVLENHNGDFPRGYEDVLALPGVGRYTAGAVCSIAYNQQVPIVDANVTRVLSRIFCIEGELKNTQNQTRLWKEAEALVSVSPHPSLFNPAMMELGALICTPKNPDCPACPVADYCGAYRTGKQNELPYITPKKIQQPVHDVCVYIGNEHGVLLRQRTAENTARNWWRGMWELPRTTVMDQEEDSIAVKRLMNESNIEGTPGQHLKTLKHTVTVHAITLDCYLVETTQTQFDDAQFFEWDELKLLAIPATMLKLLTWLQQHHLQNAQLTLTHL